MKSYKQKCHNGTIVREHRLILAKKLGKSLDELGIVDHIDGNIFNNNPDNLREVTRSQNAYNMKIPSHNKTGIKGVSFDATRNRWRCSIKGDRLYQKRFKCLLDAAAWMINKRKELHNEYAR